MDFICGIVLAITAISLYFVFKFNFVTLCRSKKKYLNLSLITLKNKHLPLFILRQ